MYFSIKRTVRAFLSDMCGSRKFCQRGFKFNNVDEGIEDPNTTLSGPSSGIQRNAIKMAFRWRADDGTALNAG